MPESNHSKLEVLSGSLKDFGKSPETFQALRSLTKPKGYLRFYLETIRNGLFVHSLNDYYERAFVASVDGQIVGWALLQNLLYRFEDFVECGIYVNPGTRGQGVGSALMGQISEEVDRKVSLWMRRGDPSAGLYRKFNREPFVLFDMDLYDETGRFEPIGVDSR